MSDGDALYDVLCYGTISLDNITRLDHLPNPRRDAVARSEYNEVGGEALQVAIPLAIWGLRPGGRECDRHRLEEPIHHRAVGALSGD